MRTRSLLPSLILGLAACVGDKGGVDPGDVGSGTSGIDADGDGSPVGEDCDDADAAIHPGATEGCDGLDNDCDGLIDAEDPSWDQVGAEIAWVDADGDGYGAEGTETLVCPGTDALGVGGDCDDANASISPDAIEICNGGVDDDCDGLADEADPDLDPSELVTVYADADGDGYGDPATATLACGTGTGQSEDATDCDDTAAGVHPGAKEICNDGLDNDCSGDAPECRLEGDLTLEDADEVFEGDPAFGQFLAVGDLDQDGQEDLIVTDYLDDNVVTSGGAVYLFKGGFSGGEVQAEDADVIWLAPDLLVYQMGVGVDVVGDVNGDGYPDLMIGAPNSTWGESSPLGSVGEAWLLYGGGSVGGDFDVHWKEVGEEEDLNFGQEVRGLGDLDLDGFADFAVGAWTASVESFRDGAVYLFYGGDGLESASTPEDAELRLHGSVAYEVIGASGTIGSGDLDGDGLSEVVLGSYRKANGGAGAVYVVKGGGGRMEGDLSVKEAADATYLGSQVDGYFGKSVQSGIDADGDGYEDLLVGGYAIGDWAGAVYLIPGGSGATSGEHLAVGEATFQFLGNPDTKAGLHFVPGDFDADGQADLAIGAGSLKVGDEYVGAIYLFYGALSSGSFYPSDADAMILSDQPINLGGSRMEAADMNGDGIDDLVAGSTDAVWMYFGGGF